MSLLKQWLGMDMGLASQLPVVPTSPSLSAQSRATLAAQSSYYIPTVSQWNSAQAASSQLNQPIKLPGLTKILFAMDPTLVIMQRKLFELSVRLPVRLIAQIRRITLVDDPLRVEVEYINGHVLLIHDVDAFPSEADIARIALECP